MCGDRILQRHWTSNSTLLREAGREGMSLRTCNESIAVILLLA